MIPWLNTPQDFPPVQTALQEPNGLLAAGGELTPEWLITAYSKGIFPWFNPGDPILWWSPAPRMVLFPEEFQCARSLKKTIRSARFEIRLNTAFAEVIAACAAPRTPGSGTWISPQMQDAYLSLHQLGYAHSVEAWANGTLAGGLYGIALGEVFFGESMFFRVANASKVAFAALVDHLKKQHCAVIDCQMKTAHLASLGAREIPRSGFCAILKEHALPEKNHLIF